MTNNKSCCNRVPLPHKTSCWRLSIVAGSLAVLCLAAGAPVSAGDAPAWMHALTAAPLPSHDEKTEAVLLYSEEILVVQPNGKIKELDRSVYKILRPSGKHLGEQYFYFDNEARITSIHGWCIPASGKDFEVKDKDLTERGFGEDRSAPEITEVRVKVMKIPAAEPGNIIGFEVEHEVRPYIFEDEWYFQQTVPVAESRYTLQLPPGWEYKAVWVNHPEVQPASVGNNQWQWQVKDIPEIKHENSMPPWQGVAGLMIVALIPPGGANRGFQKWSEMGEWYNGLLVNRRDPSPAIKQKVAELTANSPTPSAKMRALAAFMQKDIRYVAVELGIGGFQPHPAQETFSRRYGDCKDKATLLSSMLKEVGIDSYQLHGPLQASYALLVTSGGGELTQLPQLLTSTNGTTRTASLTIDPRGTLTGTVHEVRVGDAAWNERWALRDVDKDADRIKPIEALMSRSMGTFQITKATISNMKLNSEPFLYDWSFTALDYGKLAGDMLLIRPRVLDAKSSALLETKDPRKYPVEFEGPRRDSDTFEIKLPQGYAVEEVPPPVDADYSFGSYHSKIELAGDTLRYSRTFEIKQLHVPVDKMDDLKKFYRIIASDERNTAVLKPKSN